MSHEKYPEHVAFICDGNRRWAKKNNVSLEEGYIAGLKTVENLITHAGHKGIKHVSFFIYSSQNKHRDSAWQGIFKMLLKRYLKKKCLEAIQNGAKINFIGHAFKDHPDIYDMVKHIESIYPQTLKINVTFALEYSGRDEIIEAIKHMNGAHIDESVFSAHLFGPDPDLLIRTSGEKRISNFMLWQLAYTELYFSDLLFPDFDESAFDDALQDFIHRQRRFGT